MLPVYHLSKIILCHRHYALAGHTCSDRTHFYFFLDSAKEEVLKIADFPENDLSMEDCIPAILEEVNRTIPFPRHIRPDGGLNMVSSMHWTHLPDVKAKFFAGDGTINNSAATNLHTDLANAANICVHAEECPQSLLAERVAYLQSFFPDLDESTLKREKIAALWFIFWQQDYEGLRDYLRKGRTMDPIQKRASRLTKDDLRALEEEHGIKPHIFLQRVGDVVIVPANSPHQVLNINSCIKLALDFVSPMTSHFHIRHLMDRIQPMPRSEREDYIGIVRVLFHSLVRLTRTLDSARCLYAKTLELQSKVDQLQQALRDKDVRPKQSTVATSTEVQGAGADNTRGTQWHSPSPSPPPPQTKASPDFEEYVAVPRVTIRRKSKKKLDKYNPRAEWFVDDEEVKCTLCPLQFPSSIERDRHLSTIHGVEHGTMFTRVSVADTVPAATALPIADTVPASTALPVADTVPAALPVAHTVPAAKPGKKELCIACGKW